MASKAIFLLLSAFAVQGSVIPNGIPSSSTGGSSGSIVGDWDKEFDLAPLGLHMKIKYNDLTNIFKGCRLFVDFMVPKMLTTFTMGVSDIQLDSMVEGTDLTKALFDVKVGYKMTIDALVKKGTVEVVRMMESADAVTKIMINDMEVVLKDFILDTDYKNKFVMTFTMEGKAYGLRIERDLTKVVVLAVTLAGKEIDVINQIKLIMKDIILETDYKTKFVLTFPIEGKVYGLRIERDSEKVMVFAVTIAGNKINKVLILETDYKNKIVITYPIGGEVYGLRVERDSTRGVIFAVILAGKEINVIDEIKLVLKDLIFVDTDYKNKFVLTITMGGKVYGLRIERDSVKGVVFAVTIASKEFDLIDEIKLVLKDLILDTDYKNKFIMTFPVGGKVYGLRVERDSTSGVIFAVTIAGKEINVIDEIQLVLKDIFIVDTDYKNKFVMTTSVGGKVFGLRIERDSAKGVALAVIIDGTEVGVMMTIDPMAKKVHIHSTYDGSKINQVLDILYNPIRTEWGLYITGHVFRPVDCKILLKKDRTFAQVVMNFNGITLVNMRLDGKIVMGRRLPEIIKYEVGYRAYDGKLCEGKLIIAVESWKTLFVTLAPETMPAFTFEVKGKLDADYCFEISHKIVVGDITYYTMVHKHEVVFNTVQKFVAIHEDILTLPKTSPVYLILEGTNLGELLSNLIWKKALTVDWTVKNGLFYKMDYTNAFIVNGAERMSLTVITQSTPYVLRFYFPKGPEIMGINFGLMHLLGKDAVTCDIFYVPNKEVVIKTNIKNIMFTMMLPNMNLNPVMALEVTYTKQNKKAFECTVDKTGEVYKVKVLSTIFTPRMPILCSASTCQWSSNFQFEIDMTTRIFDLLPVHTISFDVTKDADTLIEIQQNVKTSPFFVRLTCPLLLCCPFEVTAVYDAGTQMVIKANRLIPGEIKVLIVDTVYTIMYDNIKLAVLDLNAAKKTAMVSLEFNNIKMVVVDLDLSKKTAMLTLGFNDIKMVVVDLNLTKKTLVYNIGFTQEPMCTITWINNNLVKNKITATIVLPLFGKVVDINDDWRCKDVYKCTYQGDVIGELPVLGKFHMTKSLTYMVNLLKSKMSGTVSGTFSKGVLMMASPLDSSLTVEFDKPTMTVDGRCSVSVSGTTVGIVVKDNKISDCDCDCDCDCGCDKLL